MTIDDKGAPNGLPHNGGANGVNGVNGVNGNYGKQASSPMPIAVVGMACRFAGGATNPEKLWDLCASGRDAWSPIPESRFDVKSLYHPDKERGGRNHATGGYFLQEDLDVFDAAFFNYSGDIANAMDPQLRQLLEIVYEATEDAGYPIEKLAGPEPNTSVFAGTFTKDYHDLLTRDTEAMPPSTLLGTQSAMFSNRISHFYDFRGPSMSIDTGCSAALSALHQGCNTIRNGESEVSIIGASNAILNPDMYVAASMLSMIGADGRCYAWDERAQGYGRGEGVACLVLKSLDKALQDGDRVHAVIRNTALNQDGRTTTITSPSMEAQVRLIRDCYRRAGLDISETGYVEAHMTGTQAGDATEAESLARTFGMSRDVEDPVWVGSVKTNVGHTEGVSGLAAIIRTAMAMKNKSIAPNLNYKVGSPKIPLKDWHLRVPTSVIPWPSNKPLRASINNFGYGGANSHVILEAPPSRDLNGVNGHSSAEDVSRLYLLSAQDAATARAAAKDLAAHLRQQIDAGTAPSPGDLAFTLAERRSRLSWVAAVRASNLAELADRLEAGPAIKVAHAPTNKQSPRLGFVFNGQGAQWHAMARELLSVYPVFGSAIDKADTVLRELGADWSLRDEMMRDAESTRVSEVNLAQPVTVALQLCLVVLLRSWGIHPSAVTSHSSGEIAAAYTAGALSFEQALGVAYWRGELARTMIDDKSSDIVGGMAAAGVGPEQAKEYAANTSSGGRVVVACINSQESVTFSGDMDDLDEVVERLKADGHFARKLKVPMAYHSHHMQRIAAAYEKKLRDIVPQKPAWPGVVAYTSPVTGDVVTSPDALNPDHYVRNLTSPVLFSEAFEKMCFGTDGTSTAQVDAIVEIGPHGTLAGPIRQVLHGRKMGYVSCLKRPVDAVETMQEMAGDLVRLGYPVSLDAINHLNTAMKFVPDLPSYPWNHTNHYWTESRVNKELRYKKFPPHELLGTPVSGATTPSWRNFLRIADLPWVADHLVDGLVVLPGAAYISMAIEAVRLLTDLSEKNTRGYRIKNVEFLSALTFPESISSGVETHLNLQPYHGDEAGWFEFNVRSFPSSDTWVENCRGLVSVVTDPEDADDAVIPDTEAFLKTARPGKLRDVDGTVLRGHVADMGVKYGPAFQALTNGHASADNIRAAIKLDISNGLESDASSEQVEISNSYVVHPTTLDCIAHATYSNLPSDTGKTAMVLPRSIGSMFVPQSLNRRAGERLVVFTELRKTQRKGFTSRLSVINGDGSTGDPVLLEMENLFCQAIPRAIENGPEMLLCGNRWEPDVSQGIPASVKESMRITLGDEEVDMEKKILRASYYLISDAVAALKNKDSTGWTAHQRALFSWMESIVEQGVSGKLAAGSNMWSRASKGMKQVLFDQLKASGNAQGSLVVRVGQKLAGIVSGEATLAELIEQGEEGDLRSQYYQGLSRLQDRSYKHLAEITRLLAVKRTGAKVLEIGAGAGGATKTVLEALGRGGNGGILADRYIVADTSSSLVELSKKSLSAWSDVLEFRELNLEEDLTSADLPTQSLDLVVVIMALHATKDLKKTLGNVRQLLKPDGKLLLVEPTQYRLDAQLILGTLPGWEEQETPARAVTLQEWDEVLRASSFTGVEFDIGDCEQPQYQGSSVILSGAAVFQDVESEEPSPSVNISLIVEKSLVSSVSKPQWLEQLIQEIEGRTGITVVIESLDEVRPEENKVCIVAADVATKGATFLDSLNHSTFDKLRRVLLDSRAILWLSVGGGATVVSPAPASAQAQGLLRSVRQEDESKPYMLLDLPQDFVDEPASSLGHIVHVLQTTLDADKGDLADVDWEYAVKDSVLHVPRAYPNQSNKKKNNEPQLQPFQKPGRTLVWESSTFVEDVLSTDKIPDDCVEIETKAFGLNQHYKLGDDEETAPAYEVGGIITRLGSLTEASGLRAGDTVCGIASGSYASTVQLPWTSLSKVPSGLSLEEAVGAQFAYAGAYHALLQVARLRKGDKVLLMHTAGDPDGYAALALANQMDVDVLLAAANITEDETQLLGDKYHLPAENILSTRNSRSFSEAVMAHTNGKGVDVIIAKPGKLSGALLQSASETIAHFGRLVMLGAPAKNLDMASLATRCATYTCVDVVQLAEHNAQLMREALESSLQILSRDHVPKLPVTKVALSQMDKSLQQIQQQKRQQKSYLEKFVVVPQQGEYVKVISRVRPLSLDDNATYLIVGSVAGIAGEIATWMASIGAKNVLLISRNAAGHSGAPALAIDAAEKGCNLQFMNCDVSNEESVVKLIRDVSESSLPPIRGFVHAAAVLEDTILERMTFEQWCHARDPKIAGATNLHKHLPNDLSFFVLLSSIIGIAGHASQTNYSSANTFEDGLARQRAAAGLPAVSIALPGVTGAGLFIDDAVTRRRVEALGNISVSIETVLELIGTGIQEPKRAPQDAAVIVGLIPWSSMSPEAWLRRDRRFGTTRLAGPASASSAAASSSSEAALDPSALIAQAISSGSKSRGGPTEEVRERVAEALAARLASMFNVPIESVDLGVAVASHGIDSLVAVELRNWVASAGKAKLSIFDILQSPSLREFASLVMERSTLSN